MENDEEAYLRNGSLVADVTSRPHTSHSDRLTQRSQQSSSANGAKKADEDRYEETPLLSREIDADFECDSANADRSNGTAPEWSGANDFAGKPWWNRPSVSFTDKPPDI